MGISDDNYARKLLDQEERRLYYKACDEAWRPIPLTYKENGMKHWAYKGE